MKQIKKFFGLVLSLILTVMIIPVTSAEAKTVKVTDEISYDGNIVKIVLKENPSTGCSWTYNIGGDVKVTKDKYKAPSYPDLAPELRPVGGAGKRYINIKSTKKQTVLIALEYGQHFDGGKIYEKRAYRIVFGEKGNVTKITEGTLPVDGIFYSGKNFYVYVSENPSTGYTWTSELSNKIAVITYDKYVAPKFKPGEELDGAAGVRKLVVKGVKEGKCVLTMTNKRSFEETGISMRAYELTFGKNGKIKNVTILDTIM